MSFLWRCNGCELYNYDRNQQCQACFKPPPKIKLNIDSGKDYSINDITVGKKAFKYNYLPSTISLKTTDEAITANILNCYDNISTNKMSIKYMKNENNKVLTSISNILTTHECNAIISSCENQYSFQNMNDNKYSKQIRSSNRLLILDKSFSELLYNRIKNVIHSELINKHNINVIPLGFGVLPGIWKITSLNTGIRIIRYNKDDHFSIHKDGQYSETRNKRSLFTLIIYLNDDFQGGTTKFYFSNNNKKKINKNGVTINEEIELNGRINNYNCITINPNSCDAVMFSQDLLHEGCKILQGVKYILKADIIVTREGMNNVNTFAIHTKESFDYKRCLNYFIQAQKYELNGDKTKANEYYERSLSVRYSYPNKLLSTNNYNKECILLSNISSIWQVIFNYCHNREIECLSYLFPKQLYSLYVAYNLLYKQRVNNIMNDINNNNKLPLFIPTVSQEYGAFRVFQYSDKKYFFENMNNCLRVVAMYSFYLLSQKRPDWWTKETIPYFVVKYDSFTQNIMAIPLYKLLCDVFYHKQCHGKYFKLLNTRHIKDEDNIYNQFSNNIDRDYMTINHGSQFLGGIGLISDKQYKNYIRIGEIEDDAASEDEIYGTDGRDMEYVISSQMQSFYYENKSYNAIYDKNFTNRNFKTEAPPNFSHYDIKDSTLKYFNDITQYRYGVGLTPIKAVKADNKRCKCAVTEYDQFQRYNYLIFDFERYDFEIIANKKKLDGNQCDLCLSLDNVIEQQMQRNMNESGNISKIDTKSIKYYIIVVEPIFKSDYDLSYNHAGECTACGYVYGDNVWADIYQYMGYTNVTHVHIAVAQTADNSVIVFASYNGFSALY